MFHERPKIGPLRVELLQWGSTLGKPVPRGAKICGIVRVEHPPWASQFHCPFAVIIPPLHYRNSMFGELARRAATATASTRRSGARDSRNMRETARWNAKGVRRQLAQKRARERRYATSRRPAKAVTEEAGHRRASIAYGIVPRGVTCNAFVSRCVLKVASFQSDLVTFGAILLEPQPPRHEHYSLQQRLSLSQRFCYPRAPRR
jgi:hypothetical protein